VGDINPFGAGLNAHSDLHSGGVLLSSALKMSGSADCIHLAQVIVEYKKHWY
jgi:hypothetical protein